ncbi:MAG: ATP synthase F1 subunit delta [Magnetococcales bacterium]|nr:ATP synthase F1 subunit delta [Magnetococcales bacterium]MBF0149309.1 ATP synthase F1 subunit delta [Magnetococcales bacterium]MBF0172320.1 ATP synthase F1 subunit delta [Magnetococcales bacterium]MBF0348520.1 ATP synthase F1 subunit delta [Magnetococcales bacterium]MBF0630663.1 ATP synthase F1 subunit delta [Magnetococcales bacterium]
MHSSTLAKRYASALADLAQDRSLLQKIGEDLRGFLSVLAATPEWRALVNNPTISREKQSKVVDVFLAKVETDPLTISFLKLLIQKRRMILIDDVVTAYTRIEEEHSGVITVRVSAPKPLIKAHEERLIKTLSTSTGKEVHLDFELDPELLGGMIVRIGSVMMDYSVRGQLNRLKAQLRG